MYDNIGGKIKMAAKLMFFAEAIVFIILGIIRINDEPDIIGILILIVGPILAWVSSWFMYGFGELIDKACDIERNTRGGSPKSAVETKMQDERIKKIEKLRAQGLITEEEYQQAISNIQ